MAAEDSLLITAAHRIGPALLSAAIALGPVQAAAKSVSLQLVDDRGKVIAEDLEVCFQMGTRSDCAPARGARIEVPPELVSVRIEGPDHGPISVLRQNLKKEPNGELLVAVPRKVLLQIAGSPEDHLSVSLYGQNDPTFRTPSFQGEVRRGSSLKVPAGDHLVSLTAAGRAPDLHLLSAKPGGSEVLAMHLSSLHLLSATDGGGRLLLVGLAPGNYEIYLAEATSLDLVAKGLPNGFLTASSLAPLTTTELEVTLEAVP